MNYLITIYKNICLIEKKIIFVGKIFLCLSPIILTTNNSKQELSEDLTIAPLQCFSCCKKAKCAIYLYKIW